MARAGRGCAGRGAAQRALPGRGVAGTIGPPPRQLLLDRLLSGSLRRGSGTGPAEEAPQSRAEWTRLLPFVRRKGTPPDRPCALVNRSPDRSQRGRPFAGSQTIGHGKVGVLRSPEEPCPPASPANSGGRSRRRAA